MFLGETSDIDWVAILNEVELFLALAYGFLLKIVSLAYHEDEKNPDEELRLSAFLWKDAAKYRTIGSSLLICGYTMVLPDEIFEHIMTYEWKEMQVGFVGIVVLGYCSDDLFLLKHYTVAKWVRKMTTMLANGKNGKNSSPKKLSPEELEANRVYGERNKK